MTKTTLSILLASTILSACSMAPSYERPALSVDNHMYESKLDDNGAVIVAPTIEQKQAWQLFFDSPTLTSIIERTLENNRDLRVAGLNVEKAMELYRIERSNLLPSINATGSGTKQTTPKAASATGSKVDTEVYGANVNVTAFEFDLFGRLSSLKTAALERYFALESTKESVRISLIAQTANAYLQYLANVETYNLTVDTLSAQVQSYKLIEERLKNGVATQQDLAQVATTVETARANEALYKRRMEQSKNALTLLVGASVDDLLTGEEALNDVQMMANLPENLPSSVLLDRPDIMAAEHQLKSANANIGAARAAFFPSISLTGAYGFASNDLGNLFSGSGAGAWSFTPQVNLPIFTAGSLFANLGVSKVEKEIAVATYEKAIQTAFKEVKDELAGTQTLADQLEAQKAVTFATQSAYDISYARYKQGVDNFLNVLDAQRSLYNAQQQAIEVERQKIANVVNLYKALGGKVF